MEMVQNTDQYYLFEFYTHYVLAQYQSFIKHTLNDHNRVLAGNLTHDDIVNLFQDIAPYLRYGNQNQNVGNLEMGPIGMFIPEVYFPRIANILRNGGYIRHAQNRIRNILSLTLQKSLVPHGRLRVYEFQVIHNLFLNKLD